MMHRKRGWAVAAVLLVVLQLLLQTRAAHIVQQNPTVTVTLSSPLTAGQLAAARGWEKPLLPAFGARKQQRSRQILTAQRKM